MVDSAGDRYAGVVVDMQDDFMACFDIGRKSRLVRRQARVLSFLASKDIPLVLVGYQEYGMYSDHLTEHLSRIDRHDFVMRTDVGRPKFTDNAFNNTRLLHRLREWEVNHLVMMGINGSACVQRTAGGAIENGFRISSADDLLEDSFHIKISVYSGWFPRHCVHYPRYSRDLIKEIQKDL